MKYEKYKNTKKYKKYKKIQENILCEIMSDQNLKNIMNTYLII